MHVGLAEMEVLSKLKWNQEHILTQKTQRASHHTSFVPNTSLLCRKKKSVSQSGVL